MGRIICDEKSCTGCGSCVQVCPKKCISLRENAEGFLHPVVDESTCIGCDLCSKACHINTTPQVYKADFHMCWNKSKEVLENSSSGGAFTAISKCIFDRGGVVFGAYQDFESRKVYHIEVGSFEELDKVRLSKYCQSDTKEVYTRIAGLLKEDVPVLFCGTACQAAGLLSFIAHSPAKNKLDILYTADVLCHGVASQKTVDAFIASKEKKYGRKITKYYFRKKTKEIGWKCGSMYLQLDDGSVKVAPLGCDTFFIGFNNNIFLRESCYQCRYCGTERISDFTIADYWGVPENSIPAEQMHYGVTVMTVNTEKARALMPELHETMEISSIDPSIAVAHNRSFQRPNNIPPQRDEFFRLLSEMDYDAAIKKLLPKTVMKANIKRIIGVDTIKKAKKLLKRK